MGNKDHWHDQALSSDNQTHDNDDTMMRRGRLRLMGHPYKDDAVRDCGLGIGNWELEIGDWRLALTVVHTQVHPQWAAKQRYSIGNIFPKALHASSTAKTNKTLETYPPPAMS